MISVPNIQTFTNEDAGGEPTPAATAEWLRTVRSPTTEHPLLRLGEIHTVELEVANTLCPLMARGIPTPFGPEDQRTSGLLAQPVFRLEPLSASKDS